MAIDARGLGFAYGATDALRGASLRLAEGGSLAVMGSSGSGKSTLLHCLAGVLVPDEGELYVLGEELGAMTTSERARFRLAHLGMVFQLGEIVSELTLLENVALPMQLLGWRETAARARALEALDLLGVAKLSGRRAGQVSGGQAQRAAVARAVAPRPRLILADEPTGSLDTVNAEAVMDALLDAVAEIDAALVVVTHDHRVAAHLERHVTMVDGRILTEAG